jgi:hypothetical protein
MHGTEEEAEYSQIYPQEYIFIRMFIALEAQIGIKMLM